jgi:hypothetical protein
MSASDSLVAVKHKNVILYTYASYSAFQEEVSIFLVSDSIGNCEMKVHINACLNG